MSAAAQEAHSHFFQKDTGVWTCACGVMADKYGKVVTQVTDRELLQLLD